MPTESAMERKKSVTEECLCTRGIPYAIRIFITISRYNRFLVFGQKSSENRLKIRYAGILLNSLIIITLLKLI